jgi:para-aminobenzoate synthetase component 1
MVFVYKRPPYLPLAIYYGVVANPHRRQAYVAASWHLDARALARYADEVCDAAAEAACTARSAAGDSARGAPRPVTCNVDRDAYTDGVERIQRYLAAGDVYQVNLSMRLRAPADGSALDLYGALRAAQPVPFGAYVDTGREQLLSNSPELFLRRRGERIETAPIKGTRPRGRTPVDDARLADELRSAAKDRAEHVMIVDLERNDLGRVCRTGSIRVERYAELASFRTLHHLVSTVAGSIAPAVTTGDLLHATFPGGSITGAPKIRAMEIIDEIERVPRGFYTGTLGWIDASGDLDLNVAIRTAIANDDGLAYHVGSGIVADSDPDREYAESILKAAAFLRALGMAAPDGGDAVAHVPSGIE